MLVINGENVAEAQQAVRDILFLYRDAVLSYRSLGHNLDIGAFDALAYLTCSLDEEPGYDLEIDVTLIHQGSAVALLCDLLNYLDDCGIEAITQHKRTMAIKKALDDRHFAHLPLAQETAGLAFFDEAGFRAKLTEVYSEYVLGYIHRLGVIGSKR